MNIAIVDDSSLDRTELIKELKRYAKENATRICLSEYTDGESFLEQAPLAELDAVFLDIYMKGLSGMDIAYQLHALCPSCRVIFATNSAAFAVQSYEVDAFYYILKPYSFEDISNAMNKLVGNLQKSMRYIKVKEGRVWCKILLSDILYVDHSNHYVQIHTESNTVSTYMKFQEIEEKLLVYSEFLACYRCILINMNKIKKVEDVFFLLSNGEYVPINRKNAKEIKTYYMDYIFGVLDGDADNEH